MARLLRLGAVLGALTPHLLMAAVQTPEQQGNVNGTITDPDIIVKYDGPVTVSNYYTDTMSGAYYPAHASLSWYKYVSDGVTAVSFDLVGSSISFGGGSTFGGANDAELAVYDSNGHFVAGNIGVETPANGDSNIAAAGAPASPTDYHQPLDPTKAPYSYSNGSYSNINISGLPILTFSNNVQPDPQWNPASPTYVAAHNVVDTYNNTSTFVPATSVADWDQYSVLPAGTYFLAVSGYSTKFAGDPHDIYNTQYYSAPGVYPSFDDTLYPFGFVDYSPMAGPYELNVRLVGDLNSDGVVDTNDLNALIQNIQSLASTGGVSPDGMINGTWVGMPYYLATYDLTGNSRVDKYDLLTFERLTGIYAPLTTQNLTTLDGSANITIDSTLLVVANGGNYSGSLQDIVLPGKLQLNGGTLTLSGNNTFSGGTVINGGTLSVSTEANLGDVWGGVAINGGTLQITGTAYTNTNRSFSIGLNGGTIALTDPNSNLTLTAPFAIAGTFTKAGPGTLTLSSNITTTSPIIISAGTLALENYTNSTAAISGAGNLSILANTTLVSDAITTAGLTVAGSVQIRSNGSSTTKLNSLTLAGSTDNWTGAFDFTNNKVIVEDGSLSRATTIATLQNQLAYGKTHPAGIFTSATLPPNVTLALLDNALLNKSTFGGVTVDASSILIAPELLGDANADGHVDLTDLSTVLNNFGATTFAWTSGNFDGAATIDLTDLSTVLNNFGFSYASAASASLPVAAPEPGSLLILLLAATALKRRSAKGNSRHSDIVIPE